MILSHQFHLDSAAVTGRITVIFLLAPVHLNRPGEFFSQLLSWRKTSSPNMQAFSHSPDRIRADGAGLSGWEIEQT